MPIKKTADNENMSVEIEPKTRVITIIANYSDVPLNIEGEFDVDEEILYAYLRWEYPIDYFTFILLQDCLYDSVSDENVINDFSIHKGDNGPEFIIEIDRENFGSLKEPAEVEKLAQVLLETFNNYTEAAQSFILLMREK